MKEGFTRREFLKVSVGAALSLFAKGKLPSLPLYPDIVEVEGKDIGRMLEGAFWWMGGLKRMLDGASYIVLKPNLAFATPPSVGATTSPRLLFAFCKMLKRTGAKICIWEHTCDHWRLAFKKSGAEDAAKEAGVKLYSAHRITDYKGVDVKEGMILRRELIIKEVLRSEAFINMPTAKHHCTTGVSLSLKNLMGTIWARSVYHVRGLSQCIADLNTVLKSTFILLDATRVLLDKGPRGPGTLRKEGKIILGKDPVAVDSYVTKAFFGRSPKNILHIKKAAAMGVGNMDVKGLWIEKIKV